MSCDDCWIVGQRLSLAGWKALTDSGLHVLSSCCNLRSLSLSGTDGVQGDGLLALAACSHLKVTLKFLLGLQIIPSILQGFKNPMACHHTLTVLV